MDTELGVHVVGLSLHECRITSTSCVMQHLGRCRQMIPRSMGVLGKLETKSISSRAHEPDVLVARISGVVEADARQPVAMPGRRREGNLKGVTRRLQ